MTEQHQLEIVHLPIGAVHPNPWNPNKQTERQFAAEVESILDNGFVMPIVVRENPDLPGEWQIIDGEHRHKALSQIIANKDDGAFNIPQLVESGTIPAVVLSPDDPRAKRLTIILNETRGSADTAEMAALLAELQEELGGDLIIGLPFTEDALNDLVAMGDYDWDAIADQYEDDSAADGDTDASDVDEHRIVAILDDDTYAWWQEAIRDHNDGKDSTDPNVAGALLHRLLTTYTG